jgi:hypothetical protein
VNSAADLEPTGETAAAAADASGADLGGRLSDEATLMLGTMKLDEVGLAPDAVQASSLLLLWQAYQSLAMSDTTAPVEIDAVLDQIEGTMTEAQLDAIAAMSLDEEDMGAFMDEFRTSVPDGGGEGQPSFNPQGGGGPGGGFTPGQGPAGGPPAGFAPPEGGGAFGGGGLGGGGGFSPEQQATAEAGMATRAGNRSALFVLRPLIAELQTLANG